MKKVVLILLTLISTNIYSQSIVGIARNVRFKPVVIRRTIRVPIARTHEAIYVGRAHQRLFRNTRYTFTNTSSLTLIKIERELSRHTLESPQQLFGSYNHLRAHSKVSKNRALIMKKYEEEWKRINDAQGYNGIHHIINKYSIKLIHDQAKREGRKFNLDEAQKNAPAIYHPLHGDPKYQHIFHNPVEQYEIYMQFGMKSVILNKLREINELNIEKGFPELPEEYIDGLVKETELWTRYHGLMWERF